MKKNILINTLLFLIVSTIGFSQNKRVADRYFKEFAYPKAAKLYEAIYEKGDTSKYVISRIADSYYNNAQTKEAELWYSKLVDIHKKEVSEKSLFNYAQSLRSNGNYVKSDSLFATLNREHLSDVKEITNFLLNNDKNKDKRIVVRNLRVNTKYSDFGGFIHQGDTYFASSCPVGIGKQDIYQWNDQPFLNLYKSKVGTEMIEDKDIPDLKLKALALLGDKEIIPSPINTRYHESNAIFTKDGKTMYFTRVNSADGEEVVEDEQDVVNLKLYVAKLKDGEWTDVEELPFNDDQYSVGHPALSPDEKTLYFTSDMPGTYGKGDIYKVAITEDGYGEPINLGKTINTPGREMFPYIGKDNTLYFASDGHPGLGLMDIFQSKILGDLKFSKPDNLDYPFNSKRDDFCFYIDETGKKGFFSSNRKGGKGDDDIYSFVVQETCLQTIRGVVRDKNTNLPLPEVSVSLVNLDGEVVRQTTSDANGIYKFEKMLCGEKYTVRGTKTDYKPDAKDDVKTTLVNLGVIKVNLNLVPLIIDNQIVINPIYFNFDKSDIREDAQYELENIVTVMNDNPEMVIKIESHTDSRATKAYNRALSDRRAKSTRKYLISRGIAPKRIESAIGYGEDRLLNHCDDAHINKCTEEEHQLNRRSYFIIVKGAPNVKVEDKKPTIIDKKPKK